MASILAGGYLPTEIFIKQSLSMNAKYGPSSYSVSMYCTKFCLYTRMQVTPRSVASYSMCTLGYRDSELPKPRLRTGPV